MDSTENNEIRVMACELRALASTPHMEYLIYICGSFKQKKKVIKNFHT